SRLASTAPGGQHSRALERTPDTEQTIGVSIVVPGLNEAKSLPELSRRISKAIGNLESYELLLVDDGSTDDTWEVIQALHRDDPRVRGLRLRRNFGKAMALASGFSECRGEIIIMMDADLQDDPADLPAFLSRVRTDLD